ncbi:MAG TPA: hypothetical protein VGZ00_00870 [Candidatus Baltobacteraceae bacterium]|nr:hypothetical protein [Candidatus Baltobacteraceae bacterium]
MYDGDDDDNVDDDEIDDLDDPRDEVHSTERLGTSVSDSTGFDGGTTGVSNDLDRSPPLQSPMQSGNADRFFPDDQQQRTSFGEQSPSRVSTDAQDGWDAKQELADAFGSSSSATPVKAPIDGVEANQRLDDAFDGSVSATPRNVVADPGTNSLAFFEELAAIGLLDNAAASPMTVSQNPSGGNVQRAQSPPTSFFGRIGSRIGNVLHIAHGTDHADHLLAQGTAIDTQKNADISVKDAVQGLLREIDGEKREIDKIEPPDPAGKNVIPLPKDLVNEINRARVEFILKVTNDETVTLQNIAETFEKVYTPGIIKAYRERRLQELNAEKDRVMQAQYIVVDFFENFFVQLPPPTELPKRRSARIATLENMIDPPQKRSLDPSLQKFFTDLRSEAEMYNSLKADLALANAAINDLERATVLLIKQGYKGVNPEFVEETLCPDISDGLEAKQLIAPYQNPSEPKMHISSSDHPRIDAKSVLAALNTQVIDEFTAVSINIDKQPPDLAKRLSQERADALLENGQVGSEETIERFRERAASFERDNIPKIIAAYRDSLEEEKRTIGHMIDVEKIFDEHGLQIDLPKELVMSDNPAATLGAVQDAVLAASAVSKGRADWNKIASACRDVIAQPKGLVAGRVSNGSGRPATIPI